MKVSNTKVFSSDNFLPINM